MQNFGFAPFKELLRGDAYVTMYRVLPKDVWCLIARRLIRDKETLVCLLHLCHNAREAAREVWSDSPPSIEDYLHFRYRWMLPKAPLPRLNPQTMLSNVTVGETRQSIVIAGTKASGKWSMLYEASGHPRQVGEELEKR
jgi:hypothetical protein